MGFCSAFKSEIISIVGRDGYFDDPEVLEIYSKDASPLKGIPEGVIKPINKEQVLEIVKFAYRYNVPLTPRGAGTGLTGGSVPVKGGLVISFEKMADVKIDPENLIAEVEPGVINGDLKKKLLPFNLFYPPDPASFETCSIGGNVATNAGGASCVKYGTTRDYVLGMEIILPSGEELKVGVKTRKGVVGYDLTRLIVGSEGTLALITKVYLRLIAKPPALTAIVSIFPSLKQAMVAVTEILTKGFVPSAIEFLDKRCLELVSDKMPFKLPEKTEALLLIELDGIPEIIDKEAERIGELCLQLGGAEVYLAPDTPKRLALWEIRRGVSLNIEHSFPLYIPEDVVVPLGCIAEFVEKLSYYEKKFHMKIFTFGHAGDGNIHLNITSEKLSNAKKVEEGIREILKLVVSMGGTISGEHGIGFIKKNLMDIEIPRKSITIQRQIKNLFDPKNILNPDKIF